MQLSWVSGASFLPSDEKDLPYTECECAAATTSGRARTCEWMKAAR